MAPVVGTTAYDDIPMPLAMYIPLILLQLISSLSAMVGAFCIIRIAAPKLGSTYQRFLFMLTLLVSFYHNALALYFNFSIYGNDNDNNNTNNNGKRQRQPEDVIGCSEIMVNATCWLIPGAIATAGAAMGAINFDPKLDMCAIYEECDPEQDNNNCVLIGYDSTNRYGTSASVMLQKTFSWILVASASLSLLILINIQFQVRRAMKSSRAAAQQFARDEMDIDAADEQQQIIQKLSA
ncbi:MAG: hypothetical protein SGARI_006580, partial [Bacillariaceae sp.]